MFYISGVLLVLEIIEIMSSGESEIKTVAGHPKAQTVGGMRVTGRFFYMYKNLCVPNFGVRIFFL